MSKKHGWPICLIILITPARILYHTPILLSISSMLVKPYQSNKNNTQSRHTSKKTCTKKSIVCYRSASSRERHARNGSTSDIVSQEKRFCAPHSRREKTQCSYTETSIYTSNRFYTDWKNRDSSILVQERVGIIAESIHSIRVLCRFIYRENQFRLVEWEHTSDTKNLLFCFCLSLDNTVRIVRTIEFSIDHFSFGKKIFFSYYIYLSDTHFGYTIILLIPEHGKSNNTHSSWWCRIRIWIAYKRFLSHRRQQSRTHRQTRSITEKWT